MTDSPQAVTVVDCVEYELIAIDASLWLNASHRTIFNSEINGRDVLRAYFRDGVLHLQATSYVGVIVLNKSVILRVRPRVPLANLTRMVIDTGHNVLALSAFREYTSRGTADEWSMNLYTNALLNYVDEVLDRGLLRAYEYHEGEGYFPRGRLDFSRTIQRFAARGITNKTAFSWHERSIDTPANRCIKAAMEVVRDHLVRARAQPRKGDRAKLARLGGQLFAFNEVSEDRDYRFLQDAQVLGLRPLPDPRAYYRSVLDLSLLILRGEGLSLEVGGHDVRMQSLLIDTNKLFERFVRVSLARHAMSERWPVEVVDGNTDEGRVDLYDVPSPLPAPFGIPMPAVASRDPGKAQPDVVLRALDGPVILVAEVKNTVHGAKTSLDALPERGEVEQAVTYAIRYDLNFALLIHPWIRGTKGLLYVGRIRSIDVYDYRLDLSSDEHLDQSLADMAVVVAGLAGLATL